MYVVVIFRLPVALSFRTAVTRQSPNHNNDLNQSFLQSKAVFTISKTCKLTIEIFCPFSKTTTFLILDSTLKLITVTCTFETRLMEQVDSLVNLLHYVDYLKILSASIPLFPLILWLVVYSILTGTGHHVINQRHHKIVGWTVGGDCWS
jgi:hypothetical protein